MDISNYRMKMLNVINENIYKLKIKQHKINQIEKFDSKFELVFTDAVLIYINPNIIIKILKQIINSSKKFILLHELTNIFNDKKINHLYVHDYKKIVQKINPKLKVKFLKSVKPGTPWSSHGTKIIIEK